MALLAYKNITTSKIGYTHTEGDDYMNDEVLIAGAGPTGLALAVGLEKHDIPFTIIDENSGPGTTSRAIVVHARTLELYRQYGLDQTLVDTGMIEEEAHFYRERRLIGRIPFYKTGEGLSPHPYILTLAQDIHEQLLIDYLKTKGIYVEWETELTEVINHDDHVQSTLDKKGTQESRRYKYVCGCDGAHSSVRKSLGIDFPGKTNEEVFFVADVENRSSFKGFSIGFRNKLFSLAFKIRTTENIRLIGIIPESVNQEELTTFDPLVPFVEDILPVKVGHVNWFSQYKIHHRVVSHYIEGNTILVGDAAHIHSPAGGQGMNTGIGDAFNLSWKLAAVIKEKMGEALLETYESERIAFARRLVATTDRLFKIMVDSEVLRKFIIPVLAPKAMRSNTVRHLFFKTVSQINLNYHHSEISEGRSGRVKAGDRLPWLPLEDGDNHEYLNSVDWQIHVYGKLTREIKRLSDRTGIPVHYTPWVKSFKDRRIKKNSVFLIRPDGYIAAATVIQRPKILSDYIDTHEVRMINI